jgi:hypothetical protein|eukprot:COSAG02_NODE_243_length_27457_cov_16.852328_6_plen_117_part_00
MRQHEREAVASVDSGLVDMSVEASDKSAKEKRRLFQEQCVRAIGVAIVLHNSMHPAMELLLRHAIQYFGEHRRHKESTLRHPLAHSRTHTSARRQTPRQIRLSWQTRVLGRTQRTD